MADHFISINRGKDGFQRNDFTTGAASTPGNDIELRIADAASLTRHDVRNALKALERFIAESDSTNFPNL